ncbi:hypothetical protein NPIL_382481 [Nephila pilipes]|uniref:Uncharacterized protein n=1 Tax=Nephila pilipes TaxID=299642 RepID=A0A8X6T931_NEPPI|nr:hypothetical protein NPIL_382481 [Nephila pilipes]
MAIGLLNGCSTNTRERFDHDLRDNIKRPIRRLNRSGTRLNASRPFGSFKKIVLVSMFGEKCGCNASDCVQINMISIFKEINFQQNNDLKAPWKN